MSYLSAKYVKDFRCNGAACNAACCRGWKIELTREDVTLLKGALAKAPPPLQALTNQVVSNPTGSVGSRPYTIQFDHTGACPYVTSEHECRIHSVLGADLLPSLCAQYPREVGEIMGRREMWASLSCPEAARLCLLDAEGAEPAELNEFSPRYVNQRLDIGADTSDYVAYLDEVRTFIVELLSNKTYPLRSRLFFVAYFAHRVNAYFQASAGPIERRRLMRDMASVRSPDLQSKLAGELDSLNVPGSYVISLVESIVRTRDGLKQYPAPGAVANATSPADRETNGGIEPNLTTNAWLEVWMDYSMRRALWERDFTPLLEQAFENYCRIYWMKEWYTRSPSLLVHTTACLLRVAILRFRLFHHPSLGDETADRTLSQKRDLLERALVTVVTEVARSIEHDHPFQASLGAALARHGMLDLAHAGLLLIL